MLITVFIVALLSAMVIGMLQMLTEEIQVMRNQIYAAEALATGEAGLNDAFAELRQDTDYDEWESGGWDEGELEDKSFAGGSYTVTISENLPNLTIESTGTSPQGYIAQVDVDTTVGTSGPPYAIRIDALRINE